jgi:hypothetical protein
MHIIVLWLTFISEYSGCRTSEIIGLCIQQAEGVGRTSRFPGHELLLNPVKAHQAIRIDDIESPYSQIPSLRQPSTPAVWRGRSSAQPPSTKCTSCPLALTSPRASDLVSLKIRSLRPAPASYLRLCVRRSSVQPQMLEPSALPLHAQRSDPLPPRAPRCSAPPQSPAEC